jgi:hypothetical protein
VLERTRNASLVVVFEPDVALLRSVLERQDCVAWLASPLLRVLTDPQDAAALGRALEGSEGLVSLGLEIADHPASTARLGPTAEAFARTLTQVVRTVRMNVVTTLAQSGVTIRNQLMNLGTYARSAGIADLHGLCAGRPGIVISAGPSVRRNLHRLAEPGLRDRFVLVATQTMLRPMLDLGVRPHFVTALDYHEISRRFYEGLTERDVVGVTLVAEAKGNAAILDAWPGALRCPADGLLSQILDEAPAHRGPIRAGATVAHLAYYLARHLGCDPVVLIGQDLGFTDGQYYAAGAAIHRVWGPELGEFCTLETLEWQRIKRMGPKLITAVDHLGRPVFTDEQMLTYRHQFERDFAQDNERGLTIIDATEGGVAKTGTLVMTLAEVLERYGLDLTLTMPDPPGPGPRSLEREALATLRRVRAGVWQIADLSRQAQRLLEQMIEHLADQPRLNELIGRVHGLRDRVKQIEPAWGLVHALNQRGTFRRARADRTIHLAQGDPAAEQRARLDRDLANVQGLAEAADELGGLMDAAVRAHEGRAPKLTREGSRADKPCRDRCTTRPAVWAALTVDPWRSDLGIARDLAQPVIDGKSALRLTLERLARIPGLAGIALATPARGATAQAAGIDPAGGRIAGVTVRIVEVEDTPVRERRAAVRGARAFAPHGWRGGAGGWGAADELVHPQALLDVLDDTAAAALLLAGADWSFVDPALGAAMLERFGEATDTNRLVFSQAAVGLAPVLIEAELVRSIAAKRDAAGSFASVGALLGYLPVQPANDPIAGPACVLVEPALRDLGERVTFDSRRRIERLADTLTGLDHASATAGQVAALLAACPEDGPPSAQHPEHLVLELIDTRGGVMPAQDAIALIRATAEARDDLALTLTAERTPRGLADVLDHPALGRIVQAARGAGVLAVQVRTPLLAGTDRGQTLLELGLDAISIDLVADDAATYRRLTGVDGFERSRAAAEALTRARAQAPTLDGVRTPWLVARLTRRDAVYEQIDAMYDRWLMALGAAVLDPLPEPVPGERIEPLPPPEAVAARLARRTRLVRAGETTLPEAADWTEPRAPAWIKSA